MSENGEGGGESERVSVFFFFSCGAVEVKREGVDERVSSIIWHKCIKKGGGVKR